MQLEQAPFQETLVRGLTHRMNNILSLFHGYVGVLLENEQLDKPTRDGLKKIKDSARAASELIDRTHALVRPSSIIWREVDLAAAIPLLRPSLESIRPRAADFEISIAENLPIIRTDLGRLKTALFELVRNAFDATAAGGSVLLKVDHAHSGGNASADAPEGNHAHQETKWISIAVIDDGPGIPEEVQPRMFQPFYSTKKKQNATGLGLNVAAGSLQQIGGVLRYESRPGRTRFEALLPASAS